MTARAYSAAGPTIARFHASDAFMREVRGPLGSSKTTGCVNEILARVCEQRPDASGARRSRWAVIRASYRQLETTTVPSWKQWATDELGTFSMSEPFTHRLRFPLPDGTRVEADVIFLACDTHDAEEKLRGLELTGVWINEAREVSKNVVDFALGRLGRYPPKRDGGPSWYGAIIDTNQTAPDHWLSKLFDEVKPEGWEQFVQPGGVIQNDDGQWVENPAAENVQNLPAGYYLKQMAGQSEQWVRVFLANQPDYVQDGRPVFPEYRDHVHVAAQPLAPLPGLPLIVGFDAGLSPAAVFGQRTGRGQWRILAELVGEDIGMSRFGELVASMLSQWFGGIAEVEVWGDPAAGARSQTDERTALSVMQAALRDCAVRPAPTNAPAARLEAVRRPLTRMVDGEPGFLLSPACKRLRRALAGGYAFRRLKVDGERYEDTPRKDEHSHVSDALQYLLAGGGEFRAVTARPKHLRPVYAAPAYSDMDAP